MSDVPASIPLPAESAGTGGTSPPRRILVRGVNWLGDAVMTTPALLRLRERFPDALIVLLTPEKLRGLWAHHPAVDEIIAFKSGESPWKTASRIRVVMWPETEQIRTPDGGVEETAPDGGGLVESAPGRLRSLHPFRQGSFDLAIVFPGSPRAALEVWLARIPRRVGYARPWRNWLLTDRLAERPGHVPTRKRPVSEIRQLAAGTPDLTPGQPGPPSATLESSAPPASHQVHHYLHLTAALGADPQPVPPRLVVTPGEIKTVTNKHMFPPDRPLLGLTPGAEYGTAKRWPADRFIAAAREIQKRTRCTWLILGGKRDAPLAREIEKGIGGPGDAIRNLAGKTSLRELCVLLRLCRVLLTNDTGPMHVAAALGTPVVVPFGSTDPELTGPLSSDIVKHQPLRSGAPCSPCFRRVCPIDFRCMTGISVETVVDAVLRALAFAG